MTALVVKNLTLSYVDTIVMKELSFSLSSKQRVLLTGPSGIGKSSLLHIITGCIPNHIKASCQGDILVFGKPLCEYTLSQKIQTINLVFQQPHWQFVSLTVIDELAFGLGSLNIDKDIIKTRIDEMLSHLDIEYLKHKKISECSLGQQQMIACAAILLLKPKILCLDEALSAVDCVKKRKFMRIIFDLIDTVIVVDHQPDPDVIFTHRLDMQNGVFSHV